ncbi:hypothetical protein [Craterilacuibacter sp.]|uniref:hypothetical protein n=1 Tax=Craterilacuibacter sp. TaxID=2870909 RepID=UPI003F29F8F5
MLSSKPVLRLISAVSLSLLVLSAAPAQAKLVNDAHRLGAFAGAMKFCAERYDEKEGRFKLARLSVVRLVDDMRGKDKIKAITARDFAYERGQFLGNKLSRKECRGLLKMSEFKRFVRD